MTVGVMLLAVWFAGVMAYLVWQFVTNAFGTEAVPTDELWTPAPGDAAFETVAVLAPAS